MSVNPDRMHSAAAHVLRAEPELMAPAATPQPDGKPPAHKARPPARIVAADELCKMCLSKPRFIIDKILTGPGAWCIIGSHKSGKTLLAVQLALSYHAGVDFLDHYKTLESRAALVIEQDDPSGLATVKELVQASLIPKNPAKFFTVEHANFTIGPDLVTFLKREIPNRDLGLVVLDSYTKMRPTHGGGVDIVKVESNSFGMLDELAKEAGCVILIIHHRSHGNAGFDWSERAAGTFAVGMSTEGEIHISRFADLSSTAPERFIQVRGRRFDGLESVIRFRADTLDYDFILEGPASALYPSICEIKKSFGWKPFTGKELYQELGLSRSPAFRLISRLRAANILEKDSYGKYRLPQSF